MKNILKSAAVAVLAVAIATSPVYAAEMSAPTLPHATAVEASALNAAFANEANAPAVVQLSAEQMAEAKAGFGLLLISVGFAYVMWGLNRSGMLDGNNYYYSPPYTNSGGSGSGPTVKAKPYQ